MPRINCRLEEFDGHPVQDRTIRVSLRKLIETAAVVGLPMPAVGARQTRPKLEMQWRTGIVRANLALTSNGNWWTKSDSYTVLDPTEKGFVSYFLGMVQAELTVTRTRRFTHLVHVDRLLRASRIPLTGSRPDFIALRLGRSPGAAVTATVEAKGRTHGFNVRALERAKEQAEDVPQLSGLNPVEHIGSEAYFDDEGHWAATLRDPYIERKELPIGLEGYLVEYYRPVVEAGLEDGAWRRGFAVSELELPDLPVVLQLPNQILDAWLTTNEIDDIAKREASGLLTAASYELAAPRRITSRPPFVHVALAPQATEADVRKAFAGAAVEG